ncbi:MAG: tyrosine-type recombinase/integrase [Ruminococcus sp.]|nr:tyrosine-type recombinase/integrase [Ruminococcus sp.]
MAICIKCKKELPDGSLFCCWCGKKQAEPERKTKSRGNGQGSVYKMPCGTWAAEVTLGYYIADGKQKRKRARKYGFRTKKEAVAYIETLRTSPEQSKTITMSELYERLKPELDRLSKSKQTAYRGAWKKISGEIAWRTIDSFSVPELQELVDGAAPTYYTRRDIKALISKLYKIAIRDDFEDKNRAEFIKLPELVTTERETFAGEEIAALWSDYAATGDKITAGMLIMLYVGIRPGELLTIRTENVHLGEHYMTGGIKTARGKRRKLIIPDKITPIIAQLMREERSYRLYYYRKDSDFYEAWISKRDALGLRECLTPYCCRHTYITRLTALGVSPAMLQELAGHEDYDTTLDYTHLSIADRLSAVNLL